ncbi:MAG: hypothetical protein AAF206_00300 [Bacteroidota bacterium]
MKNSVFGLLVIVFTLFSCQPETIDVPQEEVGIFNSKIVSIVDGDARFTADYDQVLAAAAEIPALQENDATPYEANIEEIDGKYYLRILSSGGYGTNIELVQDPTNPGVFSGGPIACSSSACNNCCGCVPNGDKCSECMQVASDCRKVNIGGGSGPGPVPF